MFSTDRCRTGGGTLIYLFARGTTVHTLEQLMLDNFVNQAAMAIYHARRLAEIAET